MSVVKRPLWPPCTGDTIQFLAFFACLWSTLFWIPGWPTPPPRVVADWLLEGWKSPSRGGGVGKELDGYNCSDMSMRHLDSGWQGFSSRAGIVATTSDAEEQARLRHGRRHAHQCRCLGVRLEYEVDPTRLAASPEVAEVQYRFIVFHFPQLPRLAHDPEEVLPPPSPRILPLAEELGLQCRYSGMPMCKFC